MARADDRATQRPADAVADAVDLLTRDHRLIQELFVAFDRAGAQQLDPLARRMCKLVRIHTQIEEEIFYPVARRAIQDDVLIDAAERDHADLRHSVARIESMTSEDAGFREAIAALSQQWATHIEDEETQTFSQLRASGVNFVSLGMALAERRDTLLETAGLHNDDEVGVANLREVQKG